MLVEECCQAVLARLLPALDPQRKGICIDVGVGTFAFYCEIFAKLGFDSVAVEPLPGEKLIEICREYDIHLVEACISDINGRQNLHIGTYQGSENLNLCSLMSDWWGASSEIREVQSITLSHLLSDIMPDRITCFKLDVEGAEYAIVKQIAQLPASLLPEVVMFEYGGGGNQEKGEKGWSPKFANLTKQCLQTLKECGYRSILIIDSSPTATEIKLDLQSINITELSEILPQDAIYGNIISCRTPIDWEDFGIEKICFSYRDRVYKNYILSFDSLPKQYLRQVERQRVHSKVGDRENAPSAKMQVGEKEVIENFIAPGHVVLDIGANAGIWAQEVLSQFSDIEIHLFEPIPQTYQTLIKNLAGRTSLHEIFFNDRAVGKTQEIKTFYFYERFPSWSTFHRRLSIEKQYNIQPKSLPVLTQTVDDYCQSLGIDRINFIKIDTEGGELDVLKGADRLLRLGKIDYLQFEYGGTFRDAQITLKEVFEYLQSYRYEIFKILPNGLEYVPAFIPDYENFEYSNFLAINERFRSTILKEPPTMLDLESLCSQHSVLPRGVIHIGAHEGKEIKRYQEMGVENVLFIEANPVVFERLKDNLSGIPNAIAVHCAISDRNGTVPLHITSMDQSSSILPLKQVKEIYPNIEERERAIVQAKTLDTLVRELELNPVDFNLLNLDIQGAELLALQGAIDLLPHIDAINTEVNYTELYEGCALIDRIDNFLETYGFTRVATTTPYHPSWGDAFYVKKPVIAMSTLGKNGRFANQVFQYAFLKIYAKQHDLRVQTPEWIGQYLFGHEDLPLSQSLPVVVEKTNNLEESIICQAKEPFENVNFWGYFQYNTKYYAPEKEYFRSLFKPVAEVESKMKEGLARLQTMGKTIVGLHLRRGDYGYGHFFVAPSEWYKAFLKGLWETLDRPVLFIASDEIEKEIGDFAEYNPVTAKDLGLELPEAEFYPDFYLLTQCDVVAISNSSFSFAACMLNDRAKFFFRPHLPTQKLIPFDPWNSETIFRDAKVENIAAIDENSAYAESLQEAIEESLQYLNLKKVNWIVFPNWHQPEDSLYEELEEVVKAALHHSDKNPMTLLIELDDFDKEEASLIISGVTMNLLLEEEVEDPEELEISLTQGLTEIQWQVLVNRLNGRIRLKNESDRIPSPIQSQLASFNLEQFLNMSFR